MVSSKVTPAIVVLLAILLASGLAGCAKGDILISVNEDESGQFIANIGFSHQMMAFIASQSSDPFAQMEQAIESTNEHGNPVEVTTRKWSDDNYQGIEYSRAFRSLADMNSAMSQNEQMEYFELKKEPALLKHRFSLDARIPPLNLGMDENSIAGSMDPSALVQLRYSVRLPGEIVESNGSVNANDPSILVWPLQGKAPTEIHVVSEVWNYPVLLGIALIGVVVVCLVLVGAFMMLRPRKPRAPASYPPTDIPPSIADSGVLNRTPFGGSGLVASAAPECPETATGYLQVAPQPGGKGEVA